jgi:threonine/homoserine/homoserine lactone efflux protein
MSTGGVKADTGAGNGEVKYPELETLRIRKAFWLAVIGLFLAACLVIVLLAFGIKASSDIVAIVGLFTSVLGTLVGAFFGIQIGSSGKDKAESRADKAEMATRAVMSTATKQEIIDAMGLFPEAFK